MKTHFKCGHEKSKQNCMYYARCRTCHNEVQKQSKRGLNANKTSNKHQRDVQTSETK